MDLVDTYSSDGSNTSDGGSTSPPPPSSPPPAAAPHPSLRVQPISLTHADFTALQRCHPSTSRPSAPARLPANAKRVPPPTTSTAPIAPIAPIAATAPTAPLVPTSVFHGVSTHDYQHRPWHHPSPTLRPFSALPSYTPYIPKRSLHTLSPHPPGVASLSLHPTLGHLLLTAGFDSHAAVHTLNPDHPPTLQRTYSGHASALTSAIFSPAGSSILTAARDRRLHNWDVETGRITSSILLPAIPLCPRFSPSHPHSQFLIACSDSTVRQYDLRDANSCVQTYDDHMGPVNSLTFLSDRRTFVTSADDKVLRLWEYGTPVVIRHISHPSAHSMPVTLLHPNGKSLICQSMDNSIRVFAAQHKFRPNPNKLFKGHLVAGYACALTTSPDGRFLASGDAHGRIFFWDWKTTRLYRALQAHKSPCLSVQWHPTRPSTLVSAGWDGNVKVWD